MSEVLDLRQELETLLSDLLGTYTYPDGATTPAINVGFKVPEGVTATGLEVVISPEPSSQPMAMQGDKGVYREWLVVLRQWDDADVDSLRLAVERMIARWPEMTAPVVVPATYETLAQARVSVPQRVQVK